MNTPQYYRLQSDYPFAGVGQVHSEKEWLRIYGYEVDRHAANQKFVPVPAEQFDCGPSVNPGLTVGGKPWQVVSTHKHLEAENLKLRDQIGDLIARLQHAIYIYDYMAGGALRQDVEWNLMAEEARDTMAKVLGIRRAEK